MLPQLHLPDNPTCGVVIEKNDEEEKVCGETATQLVTMVDPETHTKITAILLVCDRHDKELEAGKSLIFLAEDGEHLGVSYKTKEE
jgi:hypothetical protein